MKSFVRDNILRQKQILSEIRLNRAHTKEVLWAQIFHDSIKGKESLQGLPLNVGRMAGNYSFFYILNRILGDYKPNSILEFGLGESSKFISTYLDNYLLESKHIIIEHNEEWISAFNNRFTLSERSEIKFASSVEIEVNGYKTSIYKDLKEVVKDKFDLYVIDGPLGSDKFSRYNLVELVKQFYRGDEFIIVFDDYNRQGEKDTIEMALREFKCKDIQILTKAYHSKQSQFLIATEKYKFATSF